MTEIDDLQTSHDTMLSVDEQSAGSIEDDHIPVVGEKAVSAYPPEQRINTTPTTLAQQLRAENKARESAELARRKGIWSKLTPEAKRAAITSRSWLGKAASSGTAQYK